MPDGMRYRMADISHRVSGPRTGRELLSAGLCPAFRRGEGRAVLAGRVLRWVWRGEVGAGGGRKAPRSGALKSLRQSIVSGLADHGVSF